MLSNFIHRCIDSVHFNAKSTSDLPICPSDTIWKRCPIPFNKTGIFEFRVQNPITHPKTPSGEPYTFSDIDSHVSISGGSGSGKTSYLLNQFNEAIFRATDLSDPVDFERFKCGMFVMDGKTELQRKIEWLAKKFGRSADIIRISPDNSSVYIDPFNDPLTPLKQQADMLTSLSKATDTGKSSGNVGDFFDKAADKVFNNLLILHDSLRNGYLQRKINTEIPPMSFEILNFLLMDKGTSINKAAILDATNRTNKCIATISDIVDKSHEHIFNLTVELTITLEYIENERQAAEIQRRQLGVNSRTAHTDVLRRIQFLDNLKKCLWGNEEGDEILLSLKYLIEDLDVILRASSAEKADFEKQYEQESQWTQERLRNAAISIVSLRDVPNGEALKSIFTKSVSLIARAMDVLKEFNSIIRPEEEKGLLSLWIDSYRELLMASNKDPMGDITYAFFTQEYFDPANDRTIGSVRMTASNLSDVMAREPFKSIFRPGPDALRFRDAIDQGKIVLFDFNFSKWTNTAKIAAIVTKLKFFGDALGRKTWRRRDGTHINQDRRFFYIVDEFATVATKGAWTGEAGFLDKAREYKIPCILAFQSFAGLETSGLTLPEIRSIIANCGTNIWLRQTDGETNKFASESCGTRKKLDFTLRQGVEESILNQNRSGYVNHQINPESEELKFPPQEFPKLKDGEAFVRLPARFKERQSKRVQFLLHPIPR